MKTDFNICFHMNKMNFDNYIYIFIVANLNTVNVDKRIIKIISNKTYLKSINSNGKNMISNNYIYRIYCDCITRFLGRSSL